MLATICDRDPLTLALTVEFLLEHRDLTIQNAKVAVSALVHFRNRPSLGFSNCLMLEAACKAGHVPMGTFDRTPAKLEGAERIAA